LLKLFRVFAIRFKQEYTTQYPQPFLNQDDENHDDTGAVYHSLGTPVFVTG
jgi:hypothetical protein